MALYLYCVINSGVDMSFGKGIDENEAYTIPYQDISAVVHKAAKPLEKDKEKIIEVVALHQYILDRATLKFGTVLPFGPGVIIKGGEEEIKELLGKNYTKFKEELDRVKNKAEFRVQIFWDNDLIISKIEEENEETKSLKSSMKTKPGAAYMLTRKIIRKEMKKKAEECFKEFYDQIRGITEDIWVEKTIMQMQEQWQGKEMIINLSCLVHKDKVEELENTLRAINKMKGFSVRFSGPWAPFNFVNSNR